MKTAREYREERARLVKQAQDIIDNADEEKRDLSVEEDKQFDKLHDEAASLLRKAERLEKQERASADLDIPQGHVGVQTAEESTEEVDDEELRQRAWRNWAVYGMAGLDAEERQVMASRQANVSREMQKRAQSVGVDTAGGYTVFDDFAARIETALKAYSGVRQTRATILRTASGNDFNMPTSDDTSNKGELLSENTQVGEQDVVFGSKTLRAYMFSSKLVKASIQFLQDTDISNIEGWLADRLGERIGRALADYYIEGTGNNQPEGLEESTTLGETATAVDAVTYDEIVELIHSVDPAYRTQAEFLIGDDLLKMLKQLKDGEGRPLWVPGVAVREPDTILGYRYAIDQEIPDLASDEIVAYFGDFSKFHLRDVSQMQMMRLTERYADYLQVAFLLFSRHDSALLDAGTHPIRHLKMA